MDLRLRHDELSDAIDIARTAFVDALARGNAEAACAVYTPEARLLAPSAELLRGRPAIERFWRAGVESGISDIELETLEFVRLGGLAYEIGRYTLRLKPSDGFPIVERGKYVRIHERQADRSWLCALEMFNPDAAPARHGQEQSRAQGLVGPRL